MALPPGQPPRLYTEADGWKYLRIWGMGIASYDLSGSGYPDYFLTSMADQKLQRVDRPGGAAPSKPGFTDIAFPRGVTAHRPYAGGDVRPSTGWHAQFEDVTNSGKVDLFVAKGNVDEMKDFAAKDPSNLLCSAPTEVSSKWARRPASSASARRAAPLWPISILSGKIDILVVNRNSPARVLAQRHPVARPLGRLQARRTGRTATPSAAGSRSRFGDRVQRREITIGGGHASGQLGWRHFGLDPPTKAEARVIWPDGEASGWSRLAGDGIPMSSGAGAAPDRWTPPG